MRFTCAATAAGLIVHISSGAGRVGNPGLGFYSATKFALEALAEAYRHELASQGMESSIVEPEAVKLNAEFEALEKARPGRLEH